MSRSINPKHNVLRLPDVIAKSGLCRSSIYQRIAEGDFPRQIILGPRSVGWIESEVQDWIDARIDERNLSCSLHD